MDAAHSYRIAVPGTPGRHAPQAVVVVHRTGELTSDGAPVYMSDDGLRVAIHGSVARVVPPCPVELGHGYMFAYPVGRAGWPAHEAVIPSPAVEPAECEVPAAVSGDADGEDGEP